MAKVTISMSADLLAELDAEEQALASRSSVITARAASPSAVPRCSRREEIVDGEPCDAETLDDALAEAAIDEELGALLFGAGHRRGLSDAASLSHAIRLPSGLQAGSRPRPRRGGR